MKMFRERNQLMIGVVAVTVLVLAVVGALRASALVGMFGRHYTATFAEAGGIAAGSPVVVSGVKVGRVRSVSLATRGVHVDFTVENGSVSLGNSTRASVGVSTVLGGKELVLTSGGSGSLPSGATIPLTRTTSAYDINEALSTLTDKSAAIDVTNLSNAFETVSNTITATAPQLRAALQGVSDLSTTIGTRDDVLRALLAHANTFTKILSDRRTTLTTMLEDGNQLLAELVVRERVVTALLVNVKAMAAQLNGVVADNERTIQPALGHLNNLIALLQRNKKNIQQTLKGAGVYATAFGESVAGGKYFSVTLQNLLPSNLIPGLSNLTGAGKASQ